MFLGIRQECGPEVRRQVTGDVTGAYGYGELEYADGFS